MKKLPVFVEDELHARGITLKILTAACGGVHRPDGAGLADRLLFAVAALAAVMERELIRERTPDRPRAGHQAGAAGPAAGRRKVRDGHQHGHLPHHGRRSLRTIKISRNILLVSGYVDRLRAGTADQPPRAASSTASPEKRCW